MATIEIPYFIAYAAAYCLTVVAEATGRHPAIALDGVRYANIRMWVSQAKAERELGYRPVAVDDALRRAVEWFGGRG